MKKYNSIEQFRNVIKTVKINTDYKGKDSDGNPIYSHDEDYPVLKFKGTVKVHGTNAAIVLYKNGEKKYQSRGRELSFDKDNCDFMKRMYSINTNGLFKDIDFKDYVAIYGEWCGGNIQKGVAISGLDKMFIIFGIKVDDNFIELKESLQDNENKIYNILQFPTYNVEIDFNNPELIQNELIEKTIKVENECPIGKYFGISGIGEGIVFTCTSDLDLKFKSKGEKHSVSKVKTINSIDIESLEKIDDFVSSVVTNNRLEQAVSYMNEMGIPLDKKNTREFLKWMTDDVLKEEMDTIVGNNLDVKKTMSAVSDKSRVWFFNKIN